MKILVTGGCGYIGSHTLVDLIDNGFEVVSIDDNSRSNDNILDGVFAITGKRVQNYTVNLCDFEATKAVFEAHQDIQGIIHFAAYKSVPESVANPLLYYRNNISSLVNLLQCVADYDVPHFVFSSSCSVYGNSKELPVTEETILQKAESPYGHTKQIGEAMIQAFAKTQGNNNILLRYFNPVGAHESSAIGEVQEKAENLVPIITQTAIGRRKQMSVFGDDYDTRDGSCIRDYIHVMDIANAHTKALQYVISGRNASKCEVFNLGLGEGVTVLEAIYAFEKVSDMALNYKMSERRGGDVEKIYADNTKAKELLGWQPQYDIEAMMRTAWHWELKMAEMKVL